MTAPRPGSTRPRRDAPIRVDVRLTDNKGFTRRFGTWEAVSDWLSSPEFLRGTPAITSVRVVHLAAQAGKAP